MCEHLHRYINKNYVWAITDPIFRLGTRWSVVGKMIFFLYLYSVRHFLLKSWLGSNLNIFRQLGFGLVVGWVWVRIEWGSVT